MTILKHRIVSIKNGEQSAFLSKEQKIFNRLIKQIATKRQLLLDWQEVIPIYQNAYTQEYIPFTDTFNKLQEKLVYLLEKAYQSKGLNQMEKKKLKRIICEMAGELAAENDDEKLKQIYTKYSGLDLDEEITESNEMIKSLLEDMLGIDIGDNVDFRSPEEAMRSISEKIAERNNEGEQQEKKPSQRTRKKSAKKLAKEEKLQEEENRTSQSIRDIYRKLASALHPDRAKNNEEQARKAALMERVNVAYGKKDLLQLLELQLETEQIDQASINCIAEDRLKHYNRVLKNQLSNLEREIVETEYVFNMRFNLSSQPFMARSPKIVLPKLQKEISTIQKHIAGLEKDLFLLKETHQIKNWLKQQW